MTPPLGLGAVLFPTKKAAEMRVREILHTHPLGVPLDGVDMEIVGALISRHPHAADKIGAGVAKVTVDVVEGGSRGFWITRTDGTRTDFSYRKALYAPGHRQRVTAALRRAVEASVVRFKYDTFRDTDTVVCPVTGQTLDRRLGHVDHVVPFADLVDEWLRSEDMTVDDVEVRTGDGVIGDRLADPWLEVDWKTFHDERAVLRYIHPAANQRRQP